MGLCANLMSLLGEPYEPAEANIWYAEIWMNFHEWIDVFFSKFPRTWSFLGRQYINMSLLAFNAQIKPRVCKLYEQQLLREGPYQTLCEWAADTASSHSSVY